MNIPFFTQEVEKSTNMDRVESKRETEQSKAWEERAKHEMENIFPDGKFPVFDDRKPTIPIPVEKETGCTPNELSDSPKNSVDANDTCRLTDTEKEEIKQKIGCSDELVDSMGSKEEAEVYIKAGLTETEINGKKCLIKPDINWNQTDAMGRTNKERAEMGLAPLNQESKPIELHHIGQHSDSPLAELTPEEHRGKGNDTILHDKTKSSEIDRQAFAVERSEHWQSRVQTEEVNS